MGTRVRIAVVGLVGALVAAVSCSGSTGAWAAAPTEGEVAPTMVSCLSSTWCLAGGDQSPLLQWDGAAWRVAAVQPPIDDVRMVSCTSTTFCLAAGFVQLPDRAIDTVARFDGATWTLVPFADEQMTTLHDIDCASPSACMIVGNDQSRPGLAGVTLWWNGASLTVADLPSGNEIGAVSCGSPTSCTAVSTTPLGIEYHIETWSPQGWGRPFLAPLPSLHGNQILHDISCSSAGSCVAVGTAFGPGAPPDGGPIFTNPVAVRLADGRWTAQTVSGLSGVSELQGVSCVSATSCVLVGFRSAGAIGGTFILDGSTYKQGPSWSGHLLRIECVPKWCTGTGSAGSVATYRW